MQLLSYIMRCQESIQMNANGFQKLKWGKMKPKYDPINITLDTYDYTKYIKKEDEESAVIPRML